MFVELGQGFHPDPELRIRDHIAPDPLRDADRVVAYLRAGHGLIDMMDLEDDPLDPARQVMNGSSILTDGEWLWRYDFAYYVSRHRVVVPEEFLAVIRARHYIVPDVSVERLIALTPDAKRFAFGLGGGVPPG
mgnify:CR=1 FL=1